MAILPVPNLTQLEAILMGNNTRRTIASRQFFNRLLLEKDAAGNYLPIPKEFLSIHPWLEGRFCAHGAKGKPFGSSIERQFTHNGATKLLIYKISWEQRGLIDIMLMCDHGFRVGIPTIQLLNAANDKQIASLDEADSIILKFDGEVIQFQIKERGQNENGILFEKIGTERLRLIVPEESGIGFLGRGYDDYDEMLGRYINCWDTCPESNLNLRFGVLFE